MSLVSISTSSLNSLPMGVTLHDPNGASRPLNLTTWLVKVLFCTRIGELQVCLIDYSEIKETHIDYDDAGWFETGFHVVIRFDESGTRMASTSSTALTLSTVIENVEEQLRKPEGSWDSTTVTSPWQRLPTFSVSFLGSTNSHWRK